MIRDDVRDLLQDAVRRTQDDQQLPAVAVPEISIERPGKGAHGDYASAIALRMARSAQMAPMLIAEAIARHVVLPDWIAKVEVAPPGFLNFHLADDWLTQQVDAVLAAGPAFGTVDIGAGRRALVEYVSANPTGPLHVGTGRGAALGDSLARVLEHAGYRVDREYYVNDAGSRMAAFNQSVYARYAQHFGQDVPVPEDGYPGDYLVEVAAYIAESEGRRLLDLPRDEAAAVLGRRGIELIVEQVRGDLERLNVRFDRWFYEQ
ncbi:MAG: arginyl-tRNA synthetase, partial [Chloroflexota bacterium]|nr:arginyl-tRNA synthetase [Chloroflexota bacterium]